MGRAAEDEFLKRLFVFNQARPGTPLTALGWHDAHKGHHLWCLALLTTLNTGAKELSYPTL
jgi:hypothetical protein